MMEAGGKLEVVLTEVEADEGLLKQHPDIQPVPHVVLSVSDTGVGMPPEVQERIFEPFFTTKDTGKGTGMGLAVAHGIINDLGGAISVSSEIGQGTTFKVYFPLATIKPTQLAVETDEIPRGNERVLVVDDEPVLANMLKAMLENLGYSVQTFTSSEQALTAYLESPEKFDIIITDQTMPDLTGADLSKTILAQYPGQPIILSTGFSHNFPQEKALEIGIGAYVTKPITKRGLAETIRKVLDGS